MEFAEQIMVDLINQGYRGNDLREHFKYKSILPLRLRQVTMNSIPIIEN